MNRREIVRNLWWIVPITAVVLAGAAARIWWELKVAKAVLKVNS